MIIPHTHTCKTAADDLTPSLSVTEEGPRLQVRLPSLIPGQFELLAYYYYQNLRSHKLISHPTFRNTREVDIIIPADKLPPFRTFQVQVALSVANKTSGRSTISSQISKYCYDFSLTILLLFISLVLLLSHSSLPPPLSLSSSLSLSLSLPLFFSNSSIRCRVFTHR